MADEGISAGVVHVSVIPDGSGFWAKFVADNRAGAAKAGGDLGDRIGKAISQRIARSIREGLDAGAAGLGTQGARAGTEYGGKFADGLRARLTAAMRALPEPQIGAATTEADQKIRDLRARIADLRDARVGVDIDAGEALAQIRTVQAELVALGSRSPNIQVSVDAGAAAAELAAVAAEADNVGSAGGRASNGLGLLVSAGVALGPAIIPGAVAAAAAVLSIGSAAVSAFAGVGVGALAFRGVGDAVKALDAQQAAAAKSGATIAAQQKTLAGGADQVRSAEASLANTRASAADGARRAGQQIADAERAVTRAQQDAKAAQQSLNQAINDEKRSREDLAQSIKGNVLDQEQAALDVAKAKATYERAGSEENRIAYEQAKLRAEDLGIQGRRLAAEQADNARVGVDGSKRVTAAQQGVIKAQQQVELAERAVGDARAQAASQARQSAFAIAQASQAVVTAQRNIGAATVAAAATGGAALDKLNDTMGNLPASAQNFARFIFGLKGDLEDLQGVAADGILPGAQAGIRTLLPYFGDLRRFAGEVADELGNLEVRAAHVFTNPFWRQFFGFIASEAVPNLELMYQMAVNVAEGGARIIQGFSPVEQQVGGGLLNLTQRFIAFSQSLGSNKGFQDFVSFAQTEIPHVISTVTALAAAGLHVAQAYAPVGSVVVSELRLLGQVINAVPVPVITALAFAITAYKTASLLAAGAQAVLNSGLLAGIGRMVTYRTETSAAGIATTGFQRATTATSAYLGGPFGVLLGVGALAISYFAGQSQKAKQKVDELANAASEYGRILKDGVTPESAAAAADTLRHNDALAGLVQTTKEAGIASSTLVDALNGDKAARDQVVAALDAQIQAEKLAASEARGGGDADTVASKAHRQRAESLETMRDGLVKSNTGAAEALKLTGDLTGATEGSVDAFRNAAAAMAGAGESASTYASGLAAINSISAGATAKSAAFAAVAAEVAGSNLSAAEKTKLFGTILADLGDSATTSGPVFDGLAAAFTSIGSAAISARDKSALLKQTLDQLYGASISQTEAAEAQYRTMGALTTQLGNNSAGFDLNAAKSDKNRAAILGNRDALEAALQAARDKYVQDIANGTAEDVARQNHDKTIQSILDGVPKTQRQTGAVKELVAEYGAIPPSRKTDVSSPGLDSAIDKLIEAHAVDFALSQNPPLGRDFIVSEIDYLKKKISGAGSIAVSKAAGGEIRGPGGPTDDLIPAMLSNDEHVLTAAEVKAVGGHGNVYALRQMMLTGGLKDVLPGFATGGAVLPVAIHPNIKIPDIAALWQQWQAAIDGAIADPGSADLGIARTIANVAASLKADRKVLLSAMETALVESGMHNLKYGDRDSLGVFQQRPSQGWGTPAQILDVAYAARSYLSRAIANEPRYANGTAGQLAQSVQRSAFPGRYDQRQGQAEAVLSALSGTAATAGIGVSAAGSERIKAFIRSTDPLPYRFGAAGPSAYDCSGLASAVVGLMSGAGGGHGQRYFVTQDFASGAPAGFKPGAGGTLTVGVNPASHMAGNYAGLGFEAASVKSGIKIGASARKPATFQKQFHLAQGGAVNLELLEKLGLDIGGDPSGLTVNGRKAFARGGPAVPYGVYDSGRGIIPPGLSVVDNRTRAPEVAAVLNTDTLGRLGGQTPVNVVISPRDGAMRDLMDLIDVRVERGHNQVAALVGSGVRDY